MARIVSLLGQNQLLIDQVYESWRIADQMRLVEYQAAVKIQSWYRGIRIRAYMKNLDKNATRIQKLWRGKMGRCKFRGILAESVRSMKLDYYDKKATLIQKCWRGFYSRKYVFNYYKRKAYLIAVQHKNEAVLNELKEYKEYMERQLEEKKNMEKYRRLEEEAKRTHYLISTKQISGVYNSPFRPAPTEIEYLMRNVKLDPPEKHNLYVKSLKANKFESIQLPEGLPPIPSKPQGPFRDPLDVRKQRYRPFSPSLRVETEYETLDIARKKMKDKEWTERIHDKIFYPIDKSVYKKPYEPLMLTSSEYGAPNYGTKYFRDESEPTELIGGRFKTVIPPIPEFQKLNKTYV